jgi:two-component system response regulator PilR (NtrC family)
MALNTSTADTGAHILVVDDEPDLRTLYELTLLREGYQVDVAENLKDGWQRLSERRYDVLITDMRLPDGLGIELIQRLHEQQRSERCVVITAYGSAENAVESLKAGAFDYLTKPVNLRQFRTVIASAAQNGNTSKTAVTPRRTARNGDASVATAMPEAGVTLERLVGNSPGMRLVKERIAKAARGMAPVLISGESGTGKELAASALHANSHRGDGPLVAVNCGAIPENLLETEFFGVRKGAYTGATQDRDGFFQAARGGTLFLDEIGDLPLAMQSKLLRAIQERCVRPVGGTQEDAVDARIISATHKDLAAEVQAGRFRQDLYYRLNVIQINMPPLRERREDLPGLCEALLLKIARESGLAVPNVTSAALEQLGQLSLKGNVRELENLLHRAAALNEGGELTIEPDSQSGELAALPASVANASGPDAGTGNGTTGIPSDLQQHLDQQEREILIKVLQETGFNRTAAAARLGMSLRQIRYRIARLNIDAPPGSDSAP